MNTINSSSATRQRPGVAFVAQIALGLWLLLSPFVLGYEIAASLRHTVLAGAAILILALIRAGHPGSPGLWIVALLPGAWLILAPFLFDYLSMGMFWNSVVVGVLAFLFAASTRGAVPGALIR